MTTRCPFSNPQDPVSRASKIKGQGPRPSVRHCPSRTGPPGGGGRQRSGLGHPGGRGPGRKPPRCGGFPGLTRPQHHFPRPQQGNTFRDRSCSAGSTRQG
ncbi:hypothetical protein B9W64_06085 [Streptomyces sp. CS159]|nr:hypothetical protein B9W64_06085 [Streptomyces sp. CS159]